MSFGEGLGYPENTMTNEEILSSSLKGRTILAEQVELHVFFLLFLDYLPAGSKGTSKDQPVGDRAFGHPKNPKRYSTSSLLPRISDPHRPPNRSLCFYQMVSAA